VERIAVDPSGGFYVYDGSDSQIRRYDAKGVYVNSVGRKGGGPGEYQYVAAMAVTRASLLIVHDPQNARITYFQPDGKVRRAFPLTRSGFYGSGFIVDNAERIYVVAPLGPGAMEGAGVRQQFLRYRNEKLIDSLPAPSSIGTEPSFSLSTSDGMRWNFVNRPLVSPYAGGGFLSGAANANRFVIDTGGPSVVVVERTEAPVTLGSEERSEWTAMAEFMRTRPPHREYPVPRTKPYIRRLTSDHLGRIWVERFVAAEKRTNIPPRPPERGPLVTWRERATFDVFSPAGTFLGRVALPAEAVLMSVRDDRIWARTKGADGEERVSVFRLATRSR
jgi:hypothetical protein